MLRALLLIVLPLSITGCDRDETLRSYGAGGKVWRLTELNGAPFTAETKLSFLAQNRVSGTGPCNSFTATMSVPYPWFDIETLASTKRICTALAEETQFFNALSDATLSEVAGTVMILSNTDGLSMVFTAAD